MTIEDAVGPILAAAFLLGMLAEIIIPRETQPRLKFWRLIGIGFFAVSGLINVGLSNGCSFAFPVSLAQGLEQANPDALAEVEILGQGYGLHWEKLDVDLSIPGLLAGLFGTKAFMDRQRAARAGASTSQAVARQVAMATRQPGKPRPSLGPGRRRPHRRLCRRLRHRPCRRPGS